MQANLKWLLVPPAIALVLFLGPLRQGPDAQSTSTSSDAPAASATPARTSALPEMPGTWQVVSTLVGVLLLGGVAIVTLKRARLQRPMGDSDYVLLRQSLRLSQKQVVHAVEFDNEILLLGETDGKLCVLKGGAAVDQAIADEQEIVARGAEIDPDDDGAVPRDMVIPRPSGGAARPATRRATPRTTPTRAAQPHVAAKLANFKNLLARVGSGNA